MAENVIETKGLTVYYGKHRGIVDVDLRVAKGEIFGFLGPNGAGKTTTQRVLLDVIRPNRGSASMFGLDCQKQGVQARKHVSYLPGELSLYDNMKANAFFDMVNSMRGNKGDKKYREQLCQRLDLDTSRKIRNYSRGNKQKVGIVIAFMNQPDLLILDEPTGGLDPLVQQTVLELVRETKEDGRTVFFSSHILPEVQAVCDRVGIIRDGKLVTTSSIEELTTQHFKRVRLSFANTPPADAFAQEGVQEVDRNEQGVTLEIYENLGRVMETAVSFGITDIETIPVDLEEIFLTYYSRENGEDNV